MIMIRTDRAETVVRHVKPDSKSVMGWTTEESQIRETPGAPRLRNTCIPRGRREGNL